MDINPKTYPSRAFIRFTAHNQLTADATGRSVVASVQRLGGKTYMQAAEPEGEAPLETNDRDSSFGLHLGMSFQPKVSKNSPVEEPNPLSREPEAKPQPQSCGIDEALFEAIVKTTLNPNRFPDLYQSCGTQQAAMKVETAVAAEIVAAYRQIKQQRECPIVQGLNNLL
jgi:hypothetical protein